MRQALYDMSATLINGQEKRLADYTGKVLLIANTASRCGFTPQYKGLQELYDRHKDKGFEVLGFPCDQFGHQEPGSDEEIESFCQVNFGVTFTLFKKIEVNGEQAHPIFKYLTNAAPGWLGKSIKWNFTKFLVDSQGRVVKRFSPTTAPAKIEKWILRLFLPKDRPETPSGVGGNRAV
jgi:glutathione peroxidase